MTTITVEYDYIRADSKSKAATYIEYNGPTLDDSGSFFGGFSGFVDRVYSNKDRSKFTLIWTQHWDRSQTRRKYRTLSNGHIVVRGSKGGIRFQGDVVEFSKWLEVKG